MAAARWNHDFGQAGGWEIGVSFLKSEGEVWRGKFVLSFETTKRI